LFPQKTPSPNNAADLIGYGNKMIRTDSEELVSTQRGWKSFSDI
jgi:hypothetical protein